MYYLRTIYLQKESFVMFRHLQFAFKPIWIKFYQEKYGVSGVNTNPTESRCVCLHLLTNNSKVHFEKFTGQNPVNN